MRPVAIVVALLVWNLTAWAVDPDGMSAREREAVTAFAHAIGGVPVACRGDVEADPRWRCVKSSLSLERVKALVSSTVLTIAGLRQTDDWDDDNGAHFSFGGSSLSSGAVIEVGKARWFAWHEVRP